MNYFNKLKELYKNFILNKIKKNNKFIYTNSTTKHAMTSSCTLKLSTNTEVKKAEIDANLKKLINKYINRPEQLILYIKLKGIQVYRIKNAEKLLANINEEEGFLTPLKGFKACYINFILGLNSGKINFNLKTRPMFIFNINNTEIYTVARALYKYYGYKNNLPGYDYKSQEIFKKIYKAEKNTSYNKKYTIEEMYSCKEAIARDLESINFTIQLSREYEGAKKALKKLKTTNKINI